ncbi:beta-ketoacyl synthase N-terminal-like domain-containing protein, partial [Burkholderia ubonensis]|uniref:beta-ketoacyl synthase N-terminal-like domain-containing protein n=1 Tax=Burkholderia ubonensis TaxID=101571 RepID=UPI002AB5CD4A
MIRGQILLREMSIGGIPVVNVENACASGSTAFNLAVNFLKGGEGDVALALGAEKMFSTDRKLMFEAFDSAWDVSRDGEIRDRLLALGEGIE